MYQSKQFAEWLLRLATSIFLFWTMVVFALPPQNQERSGQDEIRVMNPQVLKVSSLPAQRIPVGELDDYKPSLARLPDGELLLVVFHVTELGDGKFRDDTFLFRSRDGGVTWSDRQLVGTLVGHEPYLTVLKDGTIFVSSYLLAHDVNNKDGYDHGYVFRSTDRGHSWTTTRIGPEDFPPRAAAISSRNILELPDGTLLMGASTVGGNRAFLWRSVDRGRTWDRYLSCETVGIKQDPGRQFILEFGETFLWRTKSGKLLGLVRVGVNDFPIPGPTAVPKERQDNADHMVLFESADGGRSWLFDKVLGNANGQMFPSVLRLRDGRLLLTFTQREIKTPLGLRAVLGRETAKGLEFDFDHDFLMLDTKTPAGKFSGGGFGPTVQLTDGTLVSSYSYRGADDKTRVEVVRWSLPDLR